jgi:hypothetical protein
MKIAVFAVAALLGATQAGADCDRPSKPVGPELARRQIGILLDASPAFWQTNPEAIGGVYVTAWRCLYRVGDAQIALPIATQPGDPMPCKRKVAFE